MKHPPIGTGCTSGAVSPDCLRYLPTYGPSGARLVATVYYELNRGVLSTIDPGINLTVQFVVHPMIERVLVMSKKNYRCVERTKAFCLEDRIWPETF